MRILRRVLSFARVFEILFCINFIEILMINSYQFMQEYLRNHLRKSVKGNVDILCSVSSAGIVFLLSCSRIHSLVSEGNLPQGHSPHEHKEVTL